MVEGPQTGRIAPTHLSGTTASSMKAPTSSGTRPRPKTPSTPSLAPSRSQLPTAARLAATLSTCSTVASALLALKCLSRMLAGIPLFKQASLCFVPLVSKMGTSPTRLCVLSGKSGEHAAQEGNELPRPRRKESGFGMDAL